MRPTIVCVLAGFLICSSVCLATTAHAQAAGPTPAAPEKNKPAPKPCVEGVEDAKTPDDVRMSDVVRRHFEPSYLAYPVGISGLDPLIFESSIVPHFFVSRHNWPFAFVLSPKIVVRMFNQNSVPVKTPSYMPRISFWAWFTQAMSPGEYAYYASLTLSHHSNGQTGKFFLDDGAINHETGDFSTNFFELAVYETRLEQVFFGWNQLSFVWHPGFNQDPQLKGRYGLVRLYFATTLLDTDRPLDGKLSVKVGAILDDFLHASQNRAVRVLERFPISVQYTVKVPGIDLGVYAGYYLGHDYYNIWFDRYVHAFQLGISGSVGPVLFNED